ncbi:FimV/HubP family polar landmark protein [Stenotrophomonas acidaminiphila]|uniref:FimV/HubP family polar landmark protein n=1 Tax=Stenotrophomonas acidaminiphila TaxID=128780 RepID=UPI0015F77FD7|nr:FimV/HubP family polar landmark protein [Stenotrophomonas acidaminiphila]
MRSIQGVLLLALGLYSSAALALGLGNIRVLSKPGQPLVAEIPVISSDPGELERATVGLASAATFERVGLSRPEGLVGELQFQFAQDAKGRAVVRVTSATPVQVPALSFLIEVDWGQGRLVREYSALVAAPETATAVAEPVIEAPAAAPSNLIVREPAPLPAPAPAPAPAPQPVPAKATAPVAASAGPVPAPAASAARPTATAAGTLAPVQRGQTLSGIARDLARDNGVSLDQAMVALLRANPEAFIRGNVNLLRQGAVLRVPGNGELERIDSAAARVLVREHVAQWRQARAPIPQPAVAGAATAAARPAAAPVAANDARLEIAPAVAGARQTAGTTTGLEAGGEGDMVANEQLRQAREDLATRDAELQELRERVAELEKLQAQQQSLIEMKDGNLAAAQQRLAEVAKKEPAGTAPWAWLGVLLLVVAAAGWWLSRRRRPSPLPPSPAVGAAAGMELSALAAAMPAVEAETAARDVPGQQGHAPVGDEPEVEAEAAPFWSRPSAGAPASRPARQEPVLSPEAAPLPTDDDAPAEPAAQETDAWPAADMASLAPLNPAPAGRERLELAIAYLDLGDAETARTLLNEVAAGDDALARAEAMELLGRLR